MFPSSTIPVSEFLLVCSRITVVAIQTLHIINRSGIQGSSYKRPWSYNSSASQDVRQVVRNGSTPRHGFLCWSRLWQTECGRTFPRIVRNWCARRSARAAPLCGSFGEGRRVAKFRADATGSDGGGAGPGGLPVGVQSEKNTKQQKRPEKAGDGNRVSQKEEFAKVVEKQKPVIMAAGAKVAKRIPLIKFPNRKAGETQGAKAVNRASGVGGQSQAMPSLPSATASSQPPRTTLSKAEMEAILLGGAAP